MRIHMIGHASLLIETADHTILMDPVLGDRHQEGLFEVFPSRRVDLGRMPQVDTVIISHRHLDHFDIPSLDRLPRDVQVIIPRDPLIGTCLERLGFENIAPVREFSKITLGRTTLLTTGSNAPIDEMGLVVADESAVIWNLVDTIVSPEMIGLTRSRFPQIDVLLATWQPLLESTLLAEGGAPAFPYAFYEQLLTNVGLVDPAVVVPGSCGYRHTGPASWLDGTVFPITRERFCADVERILPELEGLVLPMDPGDVLEFVGDTVEHRPGDSPFVERDEDDRGQLDYRPVLAGHALTDEAQADDLAALEALVEQFIGEQLPQFVAEHPERFGPHRTWALRHSIEVVFPDGRWRTWCLDFGADTMTVNEGRDPLASAHSMVTAVGLAGLLMGAYSWNRLVLGGYYRTVDTTYVPTRAGLVRPPKGSLPDVLRMCLPESTTFERARMHEVERCLADDR